MLIIWERAKNLFCRCVYVL